VHQAHQKGGYPLSDQEITAVIKFTTKKLGGQDPKIRKNK